MKFVQLARSLQEEGVAPVYLIEGEEAYFRDRAVKAIREACGITQPALNDVRYEGESVKEDLSAQLFTMPFLDEKRLVRIYNYFPSEKEWERLFAGYCAAPCPTTVLLFVNAGTGAGKKADLKRKKGVTFVDCAKEDEPMLSKWVFGMCKRAGIVADGDAAVLLVRFCNYDAARMALELNKLALLLGPGGRMTRAVVEENVAKDVEYKLFELTDAVARKNQTDFCVILSDLLEKGYDESAVLSVLTNYFGTLREVSNMKGSDEDVAKALGMKRYPVQKNREAAAAMGAARVDEMYLACYRLGADMRSGLIGKSGALSAAVAKIFFG